MSQKLPPALLSSLQSVQGFDEESFLEVHQSGGQITSIRFNPLKLSPASKASFFGGGREEVVPWSSEGYYLPNRPSFTSDPFFHAGAYYVQEASSMFLEEAIRQTFDLSKPLRVLDLCAAPGGKSTLIQSLISSESLLVSNEVIKARVNILSENITKWGASNAVVTNNDPKDFQSLPEYFDLIVVDAPCSGSGLFRKDPAAIDEWSLNNVELCSQRQQRILANILPALKPGGILVYSTCSYSSCEDEEIGDWLLSGIQHPVSGIRLDLKAPWNIIEALSPQHNAYGYRFYPDKLKGEGFFIAVFKKQEKDSVPIEIKHGNNRIQHKPVLLNKASIKILEPWLVNAGRFSFIEWQEKILAIPSSLLKDVLELQSVLYLKKAGVKIGTIIRDELIPDHEFALSSLTSEGIPSIDVDTQTALQYLRRHDLTMQTGLKGWALIKYQNMALGWVKILSNRINNYYPKDWRILNK